MARGNSDYTLQAGLIGQFYTLCPDGSFTPGCPNAYYTETTTGLRNITGTVNADGTVTIWGVTADSSASGDNGADPNEVVEITDFLADTTLPASEKASPYSKVRSTARSIAAWPLIRQFRSRPPSRCLGLAWPVWA